MTILLLARHAEPDGGRIQPGWSNPSGELDPSLSVEGREQTRKLGHWLATTCDVDVIYSSTLRRARETAELLNQQLNVELHCLDELREWPHAEPMPNILANLHAVNHLDAPFNPNPRHTFDPRYQEFAERIHATLNKIISTHTTKSILVVAHGHVIGQVVRTFTDHHHMLYDSDFTGISKFTWEEDRWFINYINRIDHLYYDYT